MMQANQVLAHHLAHSKGLVVGDIHSERAGIQLIIQSLPQLKSQNVKRIYTEYLLDEPRSTEEKIFHDALRADIANFYCSQNSIRPQTVPYVSSMAVALYAKDEEEQKVIIKDFFERADEAREINPNVFEGDTNEVLLEKLLAHAKKALISEENENQYNYFNLLKKAKALGIEVIAVDRSENKGKPRRERLALFNDSTERKIKTTEAQCDPRDDLNEKYILLEGQFHGHDKDDIVGMGKRLDVPVVDVFDSTEERDVLYDQTVFSSRVINLPPRHCDIVVQVKNRPMEDQEQLAFSRSEATLTQDLSEKLELARKEIVSSSTPRSGPVVLVSNTDECAVTFEFSKHNLIETIFKNILKKFLFIDREKNIKEGNVSAACVDYQENEDGSITLTGLGSDIKKSLEELKIFNDAGELSHYGFPAPSYFTMRDYNLIHEKIFNNFGHLREIDNSVRTVAHQDLLARIEKEQDRKFMTNVEKNYKKFMDYIDKATDISVLRNDTGQLLNLLEFKKQLEDIKHNRFEDESLKTKINNLYVAVDEKLRSFDLESQASSQASDRKNIAKSSSVAASTGQVIKQLNIPATAVPMDLIEEEKSIISNLDLEKLDLEVRRIVADINPELFIGLYTREVQNEALGEFKKTLDELSGNKFAEALHSSQNCLEESSPLGLKYAPLGKLLQENPNLEQFIFDHKDNIKNLSKIFVTLTTLAMANSSSSSVQSDPTQPYTQVNTTVPEAAASRSEGTPAQPDEHSKPTP